VRRCRARRRAGKAILPLEADGETFDLMIYFGGLDPGRVNDRQSVVEALARLVRLGFAALLRERAGRR
jgi:hypothetical protein